MTELYEEAAQQQAAEWGYEGDVAEVTYTRKSANLGCRWVWTADYGHCLACGDFDYKPEEDD